METFVILHNVRSAHNVGSVFRTADGAGVHKIFLTGYTPTPLDRFGRVQEEIAKTSLGATASVPYAHIEDIESCILKLREQGATLVAVEQTKEAVPYTDYIPPAKVAYIFGNEVTRVPPEVLTLVDTHIHVPMHGMKESLNVSVCVGIILFALRS